MNPELRSRLNGQIWSAAIQADASLEVAANEIIQLCREPFPGGFASYLLPFLVPRHGDLVFDVIEELTLEYKWPTGSGYAKIVLPQILCMSPSRAKPFLKDLFQYGNARQRKAVAETLRALVYVDLDWSLQALLTCAASDHETIRKEAARALGCVCEVDVFAAEKLRQSIIGDDQLSTLVADYDLPEPSILLRLMKTQRWIDVGGFVGSPLWTSGLIRSLALGLPGLMVADPEYAVGRLQLLWSATDFTDYILRFITAAHLPLAHGLGVTVFRRLLPRIVRSSDWQVRRFAVLPLSKLAASGDTWSEGYLHDLKADPSAQMREVVEAARAAIA